MIHVPTVKSYSGEQIKPLVSRKKKGSYKEKIKSMKQSEKNSREN